MLEGRGSTTVWNDAGKTISFEWQAGSIFAIPLNTLAPTFQRFGSGACALHGVTNAPSYHQSL